MGGGRENGHVGADLGDDVLGGDHPGAGHGVAVYDALNAGAIDIGRLRWAVGCLPLPAWPDGRIRLGVDVSPWLRQAGATSAGRLFCHVYRRGKGQYRLSITG